MTSEHATVYMVRV